MGSEAGLPSLVSGSFPIDWRSVPFGDAVFFQEGPGIRHWQYRDAGIPFVNIRCLVDGRLDRQSMNCLDAMEVNDKYSHFLLDAGDYVVSSSGTIGRIAEVFLADLPCMLNTSVIRMRPNNRNILDRRFLRYFLTSSLFQTQIESFASGSVQRNYGPTHLKMMWIVLPPLPEQRAIAHILGTLDDKIELSRRMNETLEEIARALFKSWFVNFDPVRAKIDGRWRRGESLPGLPAEYYDLFPDRLVDSELGEIPAGWEVRTLGSYLETLETGYRPPGGVSGIVAGIPSMGAESVERVGVFDFSKTKYVPLEFYNGMNRGIVEDGDVLIYKDGGRPGELKPAVTYISHGFPFNVFCINEHVYRVRTKRFSQQLLYCYLTTSTAFWQMRELATGVAQPGLNRRSVESIAIAVPADNRVLITCQERIGPLLDECNINSLESWGLSQIRDTLLPKLVSGEVGVSRPTNHTNGGGSD